MPTDTGPTDIGPTDTVSADTDDLDAFVDHGRVLQRSLGWARETLSRQRDHLIATGLPFVVDGSELGDLESTIGLLGDLDRFVDDVSSALKDFGADLGSGAFAVPAAVVDTAVAAGDRELLDRLEESLVAEGLGPADARGVRDDLAEVLATDRRFELYGATLAEPEGLARALAWRHGKPTDEELFALAVLEPRFELLLGDRASGADLGSVATELATVQGREALRVRLLDDGADPERVDLLADDLAAAVAFYADDPSARDVLDAAGDRDPTDVDGRFSVGDVTGRIADRRMEVAAELSAGDACLAVDAELPAYATAAELVGNRVLAMPAGEAVRFRSAYERATAGDLLGDLLPPLGPAGRDPYGLAVQPVGSQPGDLAFELARKIAPELITPHLGPAPPSADGLVVDAMDTRVVGSTLTVGMHWAPALPHPASTSTVTALVYLDGRPVTDPWGNPRRFPVTGGRFDHRLDRAGDVEVVLEVRDAGGDLRFHTYHTTVTDDRAGLAARRLDELGGRSLSVDQTIAALEADIAIAEAGLARAREDRVSYRDVERLEGRLADSRAALEAYRDRFDDPAGAEPIDAVLVVDESSVAVPLALHLEPGGGGRGWVITDMTNPTDPRTYSTDGGTVDDAFRELLADTELPPGQIAAVDPHTGARMGGRVDGASGWQQFRDRLATGSLALFVVGGVAYLSTPLTGPAGATAGTWAWAGAGVLGAGSAVANTVDRVEHGQFELASRETFFDAVDIIGGVTVVGGSVARSGRWVAVTTGIDTTTDAAATVLVAAEYHDQIRRIQQDQDLDPGERRRALDALYTQAVISGAIVLLGGAMARRSSPAGAAPAGAATTGPDLPTFTPDQRVEIVDSPAWRTFDRELDDPFLDVLGRFGGDPYPSMDFRGGEGQLFFSDSRPGWALKRWHASRAGDFDRSVELLIDARAAVGAEPELSGLLDVVEIHARGPDWIIRDFDDRSIPLRSAFTRHPESKVAFEQALTALDGTGDPLLQTILRRLDRPNGPSANVHWSPATGRLLVIDMM